MATAEIEGFRLDGGPRCVVLVHGFTGSPYEMRPLGEMLAEAGYSVIAPRLPGHGRPREKEDNAWPAWCAALDESLREAREAFPGEAPSIIGLSMGALLAIDAARRFPTEVRSLVALSPAMALTNPVPAFLWAAQRLAPASARGWRVPKGVSDIQDRDARLAHPQAEPFPVSAVLSFDAFRRRVRREVHQVRQPVLIVHARRDRTCPLAGATWLSRRIGSSVVEMHVLEQSGHVLTVDCERVEAGRLVMSFLARS
jgi:carboxylesterase